MPAAGSVSEAGRTSGAATVHAAGTDNAPIAFAWPRPADMVDAASASGPGS